MINSIKLEGTTLNYDLVKRKRKTLELRIEYPGILKVTAPHFLSKSQIENFILEKSTWVLQKIEGYKECRLNEKIHEFKNGEIFLHLGEEYPLEIILRKGTRTIHTISNHQLVIEHPGHKKEALRNSLIGWYKDEGNRIIGERADFYSKHFSCVPKEIKVKEQKKRWGSCTHDNKLLFNWRIIMAPIEIIDSIVVHEMCHMVHKNHSKEFWGLVYHIFPEYKDAKKWLKSNSLSLDIRIKHENSLLDAGE
ncbi:MAG: M48 family metallopeptidase [Eubacteriaceae bacterium]|nr:M48 family metallopeptidase [Eubacteriaceae bacterium]